MYMLYVHIYSNYICLQFVYNYIMFKILTKYILLHKKFAKFEQCIKKKKPFSRIYTFFNNIFNM